jgi:hypothetical protein
MSRNARYWTKINREAAALAEMIGYASEFNADRAEVPPKTAMRALEVETRIHDILSCGAEGDVLRPPDAVYLVKAARAYGKLQNDMPRVEWCDWDDGTMTVAHRARMRMILEYAARIR